MPQLLIAILILGLGWYGLKFFARASPRMVARTVRYCAGAIVGAVSLLLLLRGRIDLGMAGGVFALWLAGLRVPGLAGVGGLAGVVGGVLGGLGKGASGSTGASRVRSAMIEMELDHATGAMQGTIIGGPQAGRALQSMTRPECEALYMTCLRDDPEGARLLEAYLDRRFAGWRETGQAQGDAGRNDRQGLGRRPGLSEEQAYEILGLGKAATRDDVVRAHRALMKKIHPDHGGSTDVAARANEAKEVLLRRIQ